MLAFVKTWLDVIVLREGPDAIPASWISALFALLLFAAGWVVQLNLYTIDREIIGPALVAYGTALASYALICTAFGYSARVLQMLATVVACGSLLVLCSAAVAVLVIPFGGTKSAAIAATLVWFWSIPVEGHILSRTINRPWVVGIAIAVLIYMLRYAIESNGVPASAPETV